MIKWQLDHWQQEALELNGKERKVRQELEQMMTENLPVARRLQKRLGFYLSPERS
jgi:hypothetical protein